jgi:hypothetical protein
MLPLAEVILGAENGVAPAQTIPSQKRKREKEKTAQISLT